MGAALTGGIACLSLTVLMPKNSAAATQHPAANARSDRPAGITSKLGLDGFRHAKLAIPVAKCAAHQEQADDVH